jgi:hypothetical protein
MHGMEKISARDKPGSIMPKATARTCFVVMRKRCLQESSRGCHGSPKNRADIQGTYRVDEQRLL